jgi:hypothetical protein
VNDSFRRRRKQEEEKECTATVTILLQTFYREKMYVFGRLKIIKGVSYVTKKVL